ncbi:hypothetical protein AB6D33_10940 [Vibrio splendidus]
MKNEHCSFPTIGDLIRGIFNASGLLARKNSEERIINESNKKTIQMKLKRLSDETSRLDDQLNELLSLLTDLLYEVIRDEKVVLAIMASLDDVLAQYKDLIREEGTYLSYSDSVKWLIYSRGLERLVISINKNQLAFNISQSNFNFPKDFRWYLPTFSEEGVVWPIKKVWLWIYSEMGMSQRQFHLISGKHAEQQERYLENVQRWSCDRQLPSTNAMLDCLDRSLYLLKTDKNINVSECQEKSFRTALLIARISTYVFKSIQTHFGNHFTKSITRTISVQYNRLKKESEDIRGICKKVNDLSSNIPKNITDNLIFDAVTQYWYNKSDKIIKYSHLNKNEIISLSKNNKLPSRHKIRQIRNQVGEFMLSSLLRQYKIDFIMMPSQDFGNLYFEGLSIKKGPKSIEEIVSYRNKLINKNLIEQLEWLVNWSYANYYYRIESFSDAYPYYKMAFEQGKYSAGKNQYMLVNQYIEICAKNNKLKDFKKGISWANYLGLDVRWLRNMEDPESEGSIKLLYALFSKARYFDV